MKIILTAAERAEIEAALAALRQAKASRRYLQYDVDGARDAVSSLADRLLPFRVTGFSYDDRDHMVRADILRALLAHAEVEDATVTISADSLGPDDPIRKAVEEMWRRPLNAGDVVIVNASDYTVRID